MLGGKAHEVVVGVVGVVPGQSAQTHHRVAVNANQPLGLADAAALVEVGQDTQGSLVIQAGVEQRRALAFGETLFAGLAVKEATLLGPVEGAYGDVASAALAVAGAVGVEAAEATEVVHGRSGTSWES